MTVTSPTTKVGDWYVYMEGDNTVKLLVSADSNKSGAPKCKECKGRFKFAEGTMICEACERVLEVAIP